MAVIGSTIHLPPLEPPKWTQEQAVAFEAARECIGEVMAICAAELHTEESQAAPDACCLQALHADLASLGAERAALRVDDSDHIERVRGVYGARLRAYRSCQSVGDCFNRFDAETGIGAAACASSPRITTPGRW